MVLSLGDGFPPSVARLLGEAATGAVRLSAQRPVWRLPTKTPLVIRRSAQAITDPTQAAADLNWLHAFLEDLAATRFLAPRPMPVLAGKSWLIDGGYAWQAISYLPGRALMWTPTTELEVVGELLARYRIASASCRMRRQRPSYQSLMSSLALTTLPESAKSSRLRDEDRRRYLSFATEVLDGLREEGFEKEPPGVIHGDPTVRNIIVAGPAVRIVGLVDFDLAHVDALLADLAYSLYVSARKGSQDMALNLDRFRVIVRGYRSSFPLDARRIRLLVLLVASRGLLVVARGTAADRSFSQSLDRVEWVLGHRQSLEQAASGA